MLNFEQIRTAIAQGMRLHASGKYPEAEGLYSRVIAASPLHFDALHLLGVLKVDQGNYLAGAQLIQRAIGINPYFAKAHLNLGLALSKLKSYAEAIASYDRALALKTDYAEAWNSRGNACAKL